MTDDAEEADRARAIFYGAVIGICVAVGSVLCGVFVVFLLRLAVKPAEFCDEPPTFDVLAPYFTIGVGLVVAALLGRLVLDGWRGALRGTGALAFALVTTLSVAFSPFTSSEDAAALAAIASAALWGAAFLRPERDVTAD